MQVIKSFQGFRPAPNKRTLFGVSVICSIGATWLLTKLVPETALYLTLEPCSPSDATFVLAKVSQSLLPYNVCDWSSLFAAKIQRSQHGYSHDLSKHAQLTYFMTMLAIHPHITSFTDICGAVPTEHVLATLYGHLLQFSPRPLHSPPPCHLMPIYDSCSRLQLGDGKNVFCKVERSHRKPSTAWWRSTNYQVRNETKRLRLSALI